MNLGFEWAEPEGDEGKADTDTGVKGVNLKFQWD